MDTERTVSGIFDKSLGAFDLHVPPPVDLTKQILKVKQRKKHTLNEHMYKTIRRTKSAVGRVAEKIEYTGLIPQPATSADFIDFCKTSPSTQMSRFLEKRIRKKIQSRGLEESHPIVLAELIREVKDDYSKIVHYACMNLKVKDCYPDFVFTIQPYRHIGKTKRYQEYLLIRKHFQLKWILHYPIIRQILKECVAGLPYELCHLTFDSVVDLTEFKDLLKDKVRSATMAVYEFYNKILVLIDDEQAKQRKRYTKSYLDTSTGIVSVHLSRTIAHTILYVVTFSGSKENSYLSLDVSFDKGLVLQPSADDVIATYWSFIDDIVSIGTKIHVLEHKERRSYKNRYMPLCLTEEFILECKQHISSNIHKLYEPILNYLNHIRSEFEEVYSDISSEKFLDSISDIVLERGCEKIKYYKEFLNRAAYIPDNDYFELGEMSLRNYRTKLHEGLKKNIDDIFQRLSSQHLWEVTDLCDTFELIYTRASQKPFTTEELMETGKFMAWIKNEHYEELKSRVENSILNLCQIIDIGILSDDHMDLNSSAVQWLDKSLPIIEVHSINFEQLKYDAEEVLQKTVEDISDYIKGVYPLLVVLDNMDDITRVRSYLNHITLHMSKIKEIETQIAWINKEEVCLSFPKSSYSEYEDLKSYVYPFYHLLKLCLHVQRHLSVWQDGQFENLDYESTDSSVAKYYAELKKMHKTYREKLRRAQDENLPIRFRGTVDDPDILNWPAPLKLCGTAMRLIDDFKPSVEIMRIICNKALRNRHWKAISEVAGVDVTPNAGTTLRKMMKVDFQSRLNEYEIISTGATKEKQLIDSLRALRYQWDDIKFTVSYFKETKILVHLEEIGAIIDDHSVKLLNMRGSVFVKPHEVEVKDFYGKILRIDQTVKKWSQMQDHFLRLLPVFSTGYLDNIIPREVELFKKINTIYTDYINIITEIEMVIKVVESTDILESINKCLVQFEIVQSGVATYLERIRLQFPRFYFLSDHELLEIISRKDPLISQAFLKKIFPGFHHLSTHDSKILGVSSKDFEELKFVDVVILTSEKKVGELCSRIEKQMGHSLKYHIGECYKIYKRYDLNDILSKFPQQAMLVVSQVFWTENLETALRLTHNIKLRIYYQKLQDHLEHKVRMANEMDRTHLDRVKLEALITSDINYMYLMDNIFESPIVSENQFDWEAYTKYYMEKGLCSVRMMNVSQHYLYEYSGDTNPIVLTVLTDRCYRTLINAYYLHLNGLVQGPSGSGKSRTIKALATALGAFFLSFVCLIEMDFSTALRLLKGSALCGSWICLENFNALKVEVLSIVSQDIYTILSSKSSFNECVIGATPVEINPTCFFCATIRTENSYRSLPENLRMLFRTTTMTSPDVQRIMEVMLCSIGFQKVNTQAKKLSCVLKMAKDILPAWSHYRFGIKILKQSINSCKKIKLAYPNENEDFALFVTLKKLFAQVLVEEDIKIFEGILKEIFPTDIVGSEKGDNSLRPYIEQYAKENNLEIVRRLYTKILEVYACLKESVGVIIVGETFTGKTTTLNICEYIFTKLEETLIQRYIINPNSLDYDIMYGKLDKTSSLWLDGVITRIARDWSVGSETNKKWLILDGNLDPSWIENVNTILDAENKFYLESGEILTLENSTTIIFEVDNLSESSPSTVSRCRIIYMDPDTLSWEPILKSWTRSCISEWIQGHQEQILDILTWLIPPCLNFIQDNCTTLCTVNNINQVNTTIQIIQMLLDEACENIVKKEEDVRNLWGWIQATLIQAGVTGLGSALDNDSRHKFDEFYRVLWKGQDTNHPYPESFEKLEIGMPGDGLIFDYQFIYKQRGIWKMYQDLLKTEKIVESQYMYEYLVPTVDTLRYHFLLTMHVKYKYSTLLIGPSGTGKSLLIEDILINSVDKEKYEVAHINFNSSISSRQLQTFIMSKLNKKKDGYFAPPANKNFLLFIDNFNLVTPNQYGTSDSVELLRQLMDHNVWYDLTHCYPIHLENINIITAMRSSGGKVKKLNQRYLRHFSTFSINEFSEDTITRIYSNSLLHVWKKGGFPSDITTLIGQIVSATLRVHDSLKKMCKPTVNRSYYVFNLSDFTKVIKGCSRLKKETFDCNKKIHLKLWPHEVLRVYGDRLSVQDQSWLLEEVKSIIKEEFNEEEEDTSLDFSSVYFGAFQDREVHVDSRKYEEVTDYKNLLDVTTECLKKYNYYSKIKMDLILFSYALDKLLKICRVLSTCPGNVLLLGLSGSGRQSLSRLAASMFNQKIFQPRITQNYTIKEWDSDLKLVLKEAGGIENECMLLISEEQLTDESFLQNIDHLLTNGEIPNFYDADEKQEILELARLAAQGGNRNLDISSSDVFLYFNKRCKENVHLILCLNVDDLLRKRIRKHPSLLNCHLIWCGDWPDESLANIAEIRMDYLNLEDTMKKKITNAFVFFHRQTQEVAQQTVVSSKLRIHITSSDFIHLIKLFIHLLSERKLEINQKITRYTQGLAKLLDAANQILNMQKALANYQPQLEEMTKKASDMTEEIALETAEVEKASALVRKDEKVACEQAVVAQVLKSECESDLAQAIPILEDAISALNTLKPSDITLVKSMKNPPDAIKLVMAAVCVIKDVKPDRLPDPSTGRKILDYWGPSKRILGDMNFLQTLKDFDKDNIKADLMVKIRKEYLPHKDFKPQVVAKASSAAEGLCKWIIAMDMYDKVAKEVAPKKEKLEKAEKEYANTMAILNEKKEEVARLEEKLATLNHLLAEATQKQRKLQNEVDYCNKKLGSAQKLIGSLGEERVRWTESVGNLQKNMAVLEGDILISSGTIAYLSAFKDAERQHLLTSWHDYVQKEGIPCSGHFDIVEILTSDIKFDILKKGLPHDDFFVVGMVIKEFSQCYSVFIDPQYQASSWIQRMEERNHLTITKFSNEDFLMELKTCISSGKPILIHKIKSNIPACLDRLLSKHIYDENEEIFVEINTELVKFDKNFRLYMVTNLSFPDFASSVYKNLTVINFSLTEKGLADDLLKTVSEIERPELKKLKKEFNSRTEENKFELIELERKILTILCDSEADILEDEASIRNLDKSKELTKTVRSKQEETKLIEITINEVRSSYVSVAEYVANLFFCVNQLTNINVFYEFSLEWFTDLYFKTVLKSKRSRDIDERCENIKICFTYDVFYNVTFSFFQKDKLTFLFLLTIRVMLFKKSITQQELRFLIRNTSINIDETKNNKSYIEWITNEAWKYICEAEELETFTGLVESFTNNVSSWKKFLDKETVGLQDFPLPWNDKLNKLGKLILIKILRKDQLFKNIKAFIAAELGPKFLGIIHYDLSDIYNESYSINPMLIVGTPGSNPLERVKALATQKKVLNRFQWFSMDGNPSVADRLIEEARKKGTFLLLQNCHLVLDWLEKLEQKIVEMNFDNTHEDFRLWLTTNDTDNIPMELLQVSIKIIDEPPEGLKENLLRLYKKEPISDPSFYSGCPGKQKMFSRLLYGVVFFHCLLQEKHKFGVFNCKPYLFDEEDLRISLKQLQLILNEDNFTADYLEKINYVIGKCSYSGRLDNFWDVRQVMVLLEACVNTDLCKSGNFLFENLRDYGLPSKKDFKDFYSYISNLSQDDNPYLLGLDNFSMNFQTIKKSKEIMSYTYTLTALEGLELENKEGDLLIFIETLLNSLPSKLVNLENIENSVILNEFRNYNILLDVIANSLVDLRKSICGDLEMSSEMEDIFKSIFTNKFPKEWSKYSYPHQLSISGYLENLTERIEFFKNFQSKLTTRYWLPAFFFPNALLCQSLINFARKNTVALEELTFDYTVLGELVSEARHGLIIEGLFLLGAKWDRDRNTITQLLCTLYDNFPPILLQPVSQSGLSEEGRYLCPIYQNKAVLCGEKFLNGSRNFITSVLLPTALDPNYWVKRGVKLLCQTPNDG